MAPHSVEAHADPGVGPAGDKPRAIRLHWALQYRGCYHLVLAVFSLRRGPHGSPSFSSSVLVKPTEGPAMAWGWRCLQESRSVRKNISGRKIKVIHLRPVPLHEVPEIGKYGGMMDGVTIHAWFRGWCLWVSWKACLLFFLASSGWRASSPPGQKALGVPCYDPRVQLSHSGPGKVRGGVDGLPFIPWRFREHLL